VRRRQPVQGSEHVSPGLRLVRRSRRGKSRRRASGSGRGRGLVSVEAPAPT
jgi:hypothetical protein